jgi:hypothetical protein
MAQKKSSDDPQSTNQQEEKEAQAATVTGEAQSAGIADFPTQDDLNPAYAAEKVDGEDDDEDKSKGKSKDE